jgi:predicted nuclease of predicted toxin-antitoxin system
VISFLVDQNFNEHIVAGMTRRNASLEFTFARDVGLAEAPDPVVLEWAALRDLVLLTHDRRTVPSFAYTRVAEGLPMPGVFLVSNDMPTGRAIEELLIAAGCLLSEDCKNQVYHFPL